MIAVVSCEIPYPASKALEANGFTLCHLPPDPRLAKPVASHPDMLVFFAPDAVLCTEEYYRIATRELNTISICTEKPLQFVKQVPKKEYPFDILLNAAPIGNRLFCLPQHTAQEIVLHPEYRICPVKQGYAKCSCLPLGSNALITQDPSVTRAAKSQGITVLQIPTGNVRLPGYNVGFFGGATTFSPYRQLKTVWVCGNLNDHPAHDEIIRFCMEHSYTIQSIGNFPITDVGTIFLI